MTSAKTEAAETAKTTHKIDLTKGAAYLLESIFQRHEPFTTPAATVSAAKAYGYLRKANPAKRTFDFEKATIRAKDETDIDWTIKQDAHKTDFLAWQSEIVVLEMGDKRRDLCRTAIQWALKNRDKVLPQNNEHVLSLLTGFDITDDESSDDE
jgi:hypothetical protein